MQPKDYIAIAALLISVVSLFFSVRSARFNQRAKSAEIRVTLLSKMTELLMTHSRMPRLVTELKSSATMHGHSEIVDELNGLGMNDLIKDIQSLYDELESLPTSTAINSYEKFFHRIHRMSERAKEIEGIMERIKGGYRDFGSKKT